MKLQKTVFGRSLKRRRRSFRALIGNFFNFLKKMKIKININKRRSKEKVEENGKIWGWREKMRATQ
jgi:hypothetical protein